MIDVVTLPNPPKDSKVLVPIIQSQSIMIGLQWSTRDLIHWPKILILNDKYKSQPTIDLINWIIEHSIRAYYELKRFNIKTNPFPQIYQLLLKGEKLSRNDKIWQMHKLFHFSLIRQSCEEMTTFDK